MKGTGNKTSNISSTRNTGNTRNTQLEVHETR